MGVCQGIKARKTNNESFTSSSKKQSEHIISAHIKRNPKLEQLHQHLLIQISSSPFNSLSPSQQEQLDANYISSKFSSPYKFIENNSSYPELFKLLYQVCYLKCEPILGNITEEKKESDLIFFRIVLFYLVYNQSLLLKKDTAKKLILNSYNQNEKKHNIDMLKHTLYETTELCIEILIYMNLITFYLNESELKPVLQNDSELLKGKYMKVDLDTFFFNQSAKYIKINVEHIKSKWAEFIIEPIDKEDKDKGDVQNNQNMLSEFRGVGISNYQLKTYRDMDDNVKEDVVCRIMHMLNAKNMFEVFVTGSVPIFDKDEENRSN